MPNLKDIQRRIRSVEKTQQITSAMRMVAAAKLRRAQDSIIALRPYATKMYATLHEVGRRHMDGQHELLQHREEQRNVEIVLVTSDRGLCGSFNHGVIKSADVVIADLESSYDRVLVSPVGRKADEYHRRRRPDDMPQTWLSGTPTFEQAVEIAEHLTKRFLAGEIDHAYIACNEFVSAMTQTPRIVGLLPFGVDEPPSGESSEDELPYEIEPAPKTLLDVLVPQALEVSIYRCLLENAAGEHAARMAAMESATRNTEELISSLTLQYNRARQAAITKELMEIVSGAEALK